jgi:hypothetical protein
LEPSELKTLKNQLLMFILIEKYQKQAKQVAVENVTLFAFIPQRTFNYNTF